MSLKNKKNREANVHLSIAKIVLRMDLQKCKKIELQQKMVKIFYKKRYEASTTFVICYSTDRAAILEKSVNFAPDLVKGMP